ncbi:MAG: hypothetical protein GF365_01770 [Candidatus Buchananbacteria bacterium]|nr:hypothetical protein [Candidatus Buchananbacteria bacterium]
MRKILISLIGITLLISLSLTFANHFIMAEDLDIGDAGNLAGRTADEAGVQKTPDLTLLASAVVRTLLGLIGIVFFILIIYGGYSWMTAGGNDDKILKAKKLIIRAVIGLAIVASAYSIAYFVTQAIEQTP